MQVLGQLAKYIRLYHSYLDIDRIWDVPHRSASFSGDLEHPGVSNAELK